MPPEPFLFCLKNLIFGKILSWEIFVPKLENGVKTTVPPDLERIKRIFDAEEKFCKYFKSMAKWPDKSKKF